MDTKSRNGWNQSPQRRTSCVSLCLHAMVLCSSFAFPAAATAAPTLPAISSSGGNMASQRAMQQRGGSKQRQHQQHREWAREEKKRMLSRQLLTDLHSLNSDVPNINAANSQPAASQSALTPSSTLSTPSKPTLEHPAPTTSNVGKPLIPLEAGPVEAVLIAMDDMDAELPPSQRPVLGMWRSIIRSAQRQAISVIVYIVRKEGRTLQQSTASVRSLLGEDPDIDIGLVLCVEGYSSDSVWMRDFGPIFFLDPNGGVGLRLAGDISGGGSSSGGDGRHSRINTAAGEGLGGGTTSAASRRMLGESSSGPLLVAAGSTYALAAGAPTMQPSILDIRYYSDRPADDALPIDFGNRTSLPVFASELLFEGGNLLSDGRGMCIMSDRVLYVSYRGTNLTLVERKAALSESMKPFGCASLIIVEALNYDITGHVDMWLSFLDPTTLLMGMYTREQNPLDHLLLHHNAALLRSKGLEVITAPMPTHCPGVSDDLQMTGNAGAEQAGSHSIVEGHRPRRPLAPQTCPDLDFTGVDPITRTYLNVLQLNNEVLVPVYDDDNVWEGTALHLWGSVVGGRYAGGVVPVPADDLIAWHGSLHCITRTLPAGTLPVGWVAEQLREQSRGREDTTL